MEEFAGKTALVTGAGAGIGREIALRLARGGADLGLFDLNAKAAQKTADVATALGRRAMVVAGDVANREDARSAVAAISAEIGPIEILVNNAGILRTARFLDLSESDWRSMFAINLDGVFHFSQAVLPAMVELGTGTIINMSSWTGKKGVPNHAAYGATKAAIINLTQSLAGEFGEFGIRVNAVCPGIIVDTNMRAEAEEMNRVQGLPDVATRVKAIPLRRAGNPSEIAELVAFLASDRAAYMTGQAINVTGGHWMN
jgi:NAD(P)-dependent dehydrogenase (short-subunit alcohol dehydrogenase family)